MWAGVRAQPFRMLTALAEDESSVPSTHIRPLQTACNPRSSDTLPGLHRHLRSHAQTHVYTYGHVQKQSRWWQRHTPLILVLGRQRQADFFHSEPSPQPLICLVGGEVLFELSVQPEPPAPSCLIQKFPFSLPTPHPTLKVKAPRCPVLHSWPLWQFLP